jgi:hypothetical protein
MVFQPSDANGTIYNGTYRKSPVKSFGSAMTVGDFNGDGLDDVAILMEVSSTTRSIELFLAPLEKETYFSTKSTMTFYSENLNFLLGLPSIEMSDLNKDGREDLALSLLDASSGREQIRIYFGLADPPPLINLDLNNADITLLGTVGQRVDSRVLAGNFNGDDSGDYALLFRDLYVDTASVCYFLLGEKNLTEGTFDLAVPNILPQLVVPGYPYQLVGGDFNGDTITDLAFTLAYEVGDGVRKTAIWFGKNLLPGPLVDVRIKALYHNRVGTQREIDPIAAGDLTGDHKDELFIQGQSEGNPIFSLTGADLSSGEPVLYQEAGHPGSVVFYPVPHDSIFDWKVVAADFDGDGADDLFSVYPQDMGGLLTSGGLSLNDLGLTSLGWVGGFSLVGTGDFNGDGFQDLIASEDFNSIYPPYGALRFLYGFRPLTNPAIGVVRGPGDSLRVTMSFAVDGNPIEMFLSGDLSEEYKNKWMDYARTLEVGLTPEGLNKTISVRFRNAVGRESDTVSTAVTIRVETSKIVTDTNRLRPGGTASFNYHVLEAGTLRATLYGPTGEVVRDLLNRGVEQGIYTIDWDGKNNFGHLVARGVYFLVIEGSGGRSQKEILVE